MRWLGALCVTASLFGLAGAARADAPAPVPATAAAQQAAAEDLYQQGITLANQGKWAEAAAKLEESNKIDRAPGTTLNLAGCHAQLGKLASAWSLFEEAAAIFGRRSPPDARAALAKERADALRPKLSRLTVDVPSNARVPGLIIKRDGLEVGQGQWGTGIAVDAGAHVVEATAPGRKAWRTTVDVGGEAAKVTAVIPVLDALEGSPSSARGGRSDLPAYVIGGVGLATLIAGGTLVGVAVAQGGEVHAAAPRDANGDPVCGRSSAAGEDPTCADLRSKAATASTLGNTGIGLLAGGGALVAGAAIYLLLPSKDAPARSTTGTLKRVVPVVSQSAVGLILAGSF